ncbi:succinic semialdehyde dehydrogenase [Gracilaria domingensis]|nr:succinic semialdehyde dehydrogenase [Gracilaria domingensis]
MTQSKPNDSLKAPQPTPTLELRDPTLLPAASFINNIQAPIRTSHDLRVRNPFNNAIVSRVTQASNSDVLQAIETAEAAQSSWRNSSVQERSLLLRTWYQLIVDSRDDLAHIITLENGKPLSEARAEVDYSASFFLWNSQEALHSFHTSATQTTSCQIQVTQEPVGTVLAITPWNFPLAMLSRKLAPAVAAGCSVIAKPSEETPLSALALAELGRRAGAPAGLCNVLVTAESELVVDEVLRANCVRMVTFTGSTAVGKLIAAKAAQRVLRVALELGGNAPFVIFDDADLDAAVKGLLKNKFRASGQTCISANRIFVQEEIYDEFVQKARGSFEELIVGNGLDEDVQVGPMISQKAMHKVERQIDDATAKGARVVLGGEPNGNLLPVTLLADVTDAMECAHTETFGPMVPVMAFQSEEEVWERANQGDAGLAAYVYTSDLGRAMRGVRALKYGMVGVNDTAISAPSTTFGGMRESGIGREGGLSSLHEFLETKFSMINFGSGITNI